MASVVLLVLFALLVLVVLPIWVLVKIGSFSTDNEVLHARVKALENELQAVRGKLQNLSASPAATWGSPSVLSETSNEPATPGPPIFPATTLGSHPPVVTTVPLTSSEPPLITTALEPPTLPPVIAPAPQAPVYAPEPGPRITINWEQLMGAKLFAWLGGFAAFLAVAFFVKYSIENDVIPIQVRAAIGFLLSAGLIAGGLFVKSERLRVTATVLCATGIVSLYAVTFACYAVYHFSAFGPISTFVLMSLITATAFLLAVRMNAQVIAILGLLGGFLTPGLLSTGHDNPAGLFGFIALLDLGIIAVSINRSWFHLVPFAAFGTALMQVGWASKFFNASKAPTAVVISLSFCVLFSLATEIARRLERFSGYLIASAAGITLTAFGFAFYFETFTSIAAQPQLLFAFIFAADACLLALVWRNEAAARLQSVAGALTFALLAIWTARSLTDDLLPWALAAYLSFAVLHTAFPVLLERVRGPAPASLLSQLYPPLTLLLMLGPLLKSDAVSVLFWPAMLLVDVIAVGLALATASIGALAFVLVLSMGAMGVCIFKLGANDLSPGLLLWIIAGFSLFFFGAGLFVARRFGERRAAAGGTEHRVGNTAAQIPALSALLPFLLLIMMSQRLSLPSPSPLFGLALLCCILILGLTRLLTLGWLPLCGLIGAAALEDAWYAKQFNGTQASLPLLWFAGFYGLFAVYPFVFRRHFASITGPWAVAALSGVALLFLTLVFPIQFDRQWITIGWALEGVALLWLFQRVPHPGLRATGVVLLVIAFCRLALNQAVLLYHLRSDTPIFNWFLYAYGVAIVSLFVGARLLSPMRERVPGLNATPLLDALGVILSFLLLNIEIADFFSAAGMPLTFQFGGNFARDLAYTIGWALFALALLGVGIWRSARMARFAALALLGVTMLKLFFHDLARLGALYRVGALFVVAMVAILASFLYQRFVPGDERTRPPQS
ncbi:MAG: DUF2339 domain-containing protein [Opitutus sp.]